MKRSVPSEFDPVYPYGRKKSSSLPPFYSFNGLEEKPIGVLSVKLSNPIDFNQSGALTLKLGGGVRINDDGELESDSTPSTAEYPLEYSNGSFKILTGAGLQVLNNLLTLKPQSPLTITADESLGINISPPLSLNENSLALNVGSGLGVVNETLNIRTSSPIVISNNTLSLKYGRGLYWNSSTATMDVNIRAPFTYNTGENASIGIAIGNGLALSGNNLGSHLYLKVLQPLSFYNGSLVLSIGDGLQVVNGVLSTTSSAMTLNETTAVSSDESGIQRGSYDFNSKVSFYWEIIPTDQNFRIYNLHCTSFTPETTFSTWNFASEDSKFTEFLQNIDEMKTVINQIDDSNVISIPTTIQYSINDNLLKITFSREVQANKPLCSWWGSISKPMEETSWTGPSI